MKVRAAVAYEAKKPLEVTEVPEAHWAATSLETCIDPGSNRVTGGLQVHGGPGDEEGFITCQDIAAELEDVATELDAFNKKPKKAAAKKTKTA